MELLKDCYLFSLLVPRSGKFQFFEPLAQVEDLMSKTMAGVGVLESWASLLWHRNMQYKRKGMTR